MKSGKSPEGQTRIRLTITHEQQQRKSLLDAYLLALLLGYLGAHHFYLRRPWYGVAYLLTFGLFGVGYVIDLFRLPCLVYEANLAVREQRVHPKKSMCDAYVLWLPFGILGFHLFYLGKPAQGIVYMLTLGLFGIGFLVDIFRIPSMVREANERRPGYVPPKTIPDAYLFVLCPLGPLGAHHYYLNRPVWGLLYTFTLGLFGVGWIYDWFRMSCLVKRANAINCLEKDPGLKYNDDIYILWFPFGFLGLHHYYLDRPLWALLYTFTLGLFGLGWLIDFCRLPCLVREFNRSYVERQLIAERTRAQFGGTIRNTPSGQTVVTVPNINYGAAKNSLPPVMEPPPYEYQSPPGYQQLGCQTGYQQGAACSNAGFEDVACQVAHHNTDTALNPNKPPSYDQSTNGSPPAYPHTGSDQKRDSRT